MDKSEEKKDRGSGDNGLADQLGRILLQVFAASERVHCERGESKNDENRMEGVFAGYEGVRDGIANRQIEKIRDEYDCCNDRKNLSIQSHLRYELSERVDKKVLQKTGWRLFISCIVRKKDTPVAGIRSIIGVRTER